jgi:large subunit ribosomal protein L19
MDISAMVNNKSNPNIPELAAGDSVKVSVKVIEGEKERIQIFQGVIIGLHRNAGGNFTVRRVTAGVGVERTFPFESPLVSKVEIIRHGKVRRAKLFYLRGLSGKASRLKSRQMEKKEALPGEEPVASAEAIPAAAPVEETAKKAE